MFNKGYILLACFCLAGLLTCYTEANKQHYQLYRTSCYSSWRKRWFWCKKSKSVTIPNGICYFLRTHYASRQLTTSSCYTKYKTQSYDCSVSGWGWATCYKKKSYLVYYTTYKTEYYATYSSERGCCGNYRTEGALCKPICSPACSENGFCYSPNVCWCHDPYKWEGARCRDDVALKKWCDSIDNEKVTSYRLRNVVLKKKYCSRIDEVGVDYNSREAKRVSALIKRDASRASASTAKLLIYKFWKHHPVVRDACCFGETEFYMEYLNTLLKFDGNFKPYVDALSKDAAKELQEELTTYCKSPSDSMFCRMKEVLELINKGADAPNPTSWPDHHKKAFQVNFILLKRKHPQYFSDINLTPDQEENIMIAQMDYILDCYGRNNIAALEKLTSYLPSDREYKKDQLCNNDNVCLFLKVVQEVQNFIREVKAYKNPPKLGGRVRRVVTTGVDFKAYLKQTQMDRITKLSVNQDKKSKIIADQLKKEIVGGFSRLGTYFEEVHQFNNKIIKADISDGQLQSYITDLSNLLPEVTKGVNNVIKKAFKVVGLNLVEKMARFLADLLGALNPIKWLTGGDATPATQVKDSFDEMVNAAASLDIVKNTMRAARTLFNKARLVAEGFDKNQEFLDNVKIIVNRKSDTDAEFQRAKEDFLNSYSNYNPEVTRPQIAELASYWENVLSSVCDQVADTSSTTGALGKPEVHMQCMENFIKIEKMMETYVEIYDFQFDLMDSLAASMRAQNAIAAARKLHKEFESVSKLDRNDGTTFTTLVIIGGLNYVTYRAQILQAVLLYCNVLEYKDNFITKQGICKGPDTSLASLVSFTPRSCSLDVLKFYHDVPVKPSNDNDEAYLDIDKLYSEETVYFKIPNSQWLVDKKWIFASQKNYAIFVQQFEVYLPTKSTTNRNILVEAKPLFNEKHPGGTVYDVEPQNSLQYDYTEGPTASVSCHTGSSNHHPYTTCSAPSGNTICHNTRKVTREVYPSIYTRWSLKIQGYKGVTPPKPANTDFTLKIGMRLCKLSPTAGIAEVREEGAGLLVADTQQACCTGGKYRAGTNASGGVCKTCPANSYATLSGYYCQKNN